MALMLHIHVFNSTPYFNLNRFLGSEKICYNLNNADVLAKTVNGYSTKLKSSFSLKSVKFDFFLEMLNFLCNI